MTKQTRDLLPIPGSKIVGRGIYIRPRQPYELKEKLIRLNDSKSYYAKETDQTYSIPGGYEVDDSPPLPANQMLNQTVIEESWERFDKQMSLDASLAASNGVFSIDVSTIQAKQVRTEEEAYYALRSSFIPLWTIYLPDVTIFDEERFTLDVPVPFSHADRQAYENFFDHYGTHYVKRVWVGGKATLVFTVVKSSEMTKEEIQAGIKASYMGRKRKA